MCSSGGKYLLQVSAHCLLTSCKNCLLFHSLDCKGNCYSRSKKVPKMVKAPNCQNKNWRMCDLDNIIFDELKKISLNPDYINTLKEKENIKTDSADKSTLIKKEIKKLEEQISRFLDLYGNGMFTIEQVSNKVGPLNEKKLALEEEILNLNSEITPLSEDEALNIVKDFDSVLEYGDFDKIRLVIESLIRYIELDNEDVYIHWKFA